MNEGRTDKRLARLMRATLIVSSGGSYDLLIQNVSEHGVGGRFTGARLSHGDRIVIEIPTLGRFHGVVRWQSDTRIGLLLDEELDAEHILFTSGTMTRKKEPYQVPDRAIPVATTWRPGFDKDK